MGKEIKPDEEIANPWKGDKPEDPKAKKNSKAKTKAKNKKEYPRADEELHKEDTKPDVTQFTIPKGINPYGFIHVPKKARGSLPFEQGAPLKAKINGETLVIRGE